MGINVIGAPSGGGLSNDFILNKADTTNDTFILPRPFEAGGYALVTSSNDSSFDVYFINAAGSSVGYTNDSTIVASEPFDTVVFLGIGTAETVQFQYRGPSTNATTSGQEPGAGAYLTSISPADLPNIDDTATVIGGNFGTATQITFESGTAVKAAKNIVVTSSTALVVTRPDDLIEDLAPYDLRAVNTGVPQPTIGINVLTGTVTAGADPTFITTSPLLGAGTGVAFSTAILTSDSDGTVVNWAITAGTLPPGLALATATGVIAGTPTTNGDYTFTVRITDDGNNTNTREYNLPVGEIITGANSTVVGGTTYLWWTATGNLVYKNTNKSLEYLVIAGGGGGGSSANQSSGGGGGGAGGILLGTATPSGGTTIITVGAAGNGGTGNGGGGGAGIGGNGTNSIMAAIATATGGGGGGGYFGTANPGGSGGGSGSQVNSPGTGISGQGNAGGSGSGAFAGGGGGRGEAGNTDGNSAGGDGTALGAWASAVNIIYNAGMFAGGGSGGNASALIAGGDGGGGRGASSGTAATAGSANSGGGGGGGSTTTGANGGAGLVVVRFS
jgi:hypothetical protein